MFLVGQKVWHRTRQHSGTVLECDGDRVFIEQDNGAELEFPASDLTASPPAGAKAAGGEAMTNARPGSLAAQGAPNRTLKAGDITEEHKRVLGKVPVRMVQAVAAVYERRSRVAKFGALDVAGKLNVIADITAVPYLKMREYSDRPGELGLMMGKGLADSRGAG